MKRIIFLLLPFLPYLASAQVAKDTVTVLTLAQIPAGAIRDTTNITFVQDNAFAKATFDSLQSYVRRKLAGDRGDIDVSADGLTWTVDTNAIVEADIATGAVTAGKIGTGAVTGDKLAASSVNLTAAAGKVTGILPIANGGTNSATQNFVDLTTAQTVAGAKTFTSDLTLIASGFQPFILRRPINSVGFSLELPFFLQNQNSAYVNYAATRGVIRDTSPGAEDGEFQIHTMSNGTQTSKVVVDSNGYLGIGVSFSAPTERLHVVGNARITAVGTASASNSALYITNTGVLSTNSSDVDKKHNIRQLPYGLSTINNLNPVAFNWNDDDSEDIGFVAQDISQHIPETVISNWNGDLIFRQEKIIPVLVKAIQEQQAQIEQLKQRITQLENK